MEFKYELKRMNVVKVTNDDDVRDKLIAEGYIYRTEKGCSSY